MDAPSCQKQKASSQMPPHLRSGSLLPETQWKSIQHERSPRLSKAEWLAVHGEAAREVIMKEKEERQKKLLEKKNNQGHQQEAEGEEHQATEDDCLEEEAEDVHHGCMDLAPFMSVGRINLDPPKKKKLSPSDEARDKICKALKKHEAMNKYRFDPEDDFKYRKKLWEKNYVYKKPWLLEEILLK